MPERVIGLLLAGLLLAGQVAAELSVDRSVEYRGAVERGAYLLHAGGCISCHTADDEDANPLAGGHALKTAFGTFYSPNITPDEASGIGTWSDEDFLRAMQEGRRPDDAHYYPVFPYTAYTGMNRDDILAIKAYLFSLEPAVQQNPDHDLPWYLSSRLTAWAWKFLFFTPQRFTPDDGQSKAWNRGAYLVRHLGHCGECHTPRNVLGAVKPSLELSGNSDGPDGKKVPNITPDRNNGIGKWSVGEIDFFLELGMLPDGDFTGSSMSPVIDDNTSHLTPDDRQAIVLYLQSLPALNTGHNNNDKNAGS
jgi:mono/diheme cytochrome c family protein